MDLPINIELIFFHIEKCGGTSIRAMLNKYFMNIFNANQIFIPESANDLTLNYLPECLDKIKEMYVFDNIKIILSHIRYNDLIFKNTIKPLLFTVLRDPIDRVISHYYFFDYNTNNNCHMIDLNDIEFTNYCNYYGSHMSLCLGILNKDGTIDEHLCNQCIKEFAYIALLETLDNDIKHINKLLNNKYNCNFTIDILNENKNCSIFIKDHKLLKSKIEFFCKNDLYLYKKVKLEKEKSIEYVDNINL